MAAAVSVPAASVSSTSATAAAAAECSWPTSRGCVQGLSRGWAECNDCCQLPVRTR